MPFGSFFSKFKEINISTADDKEIKFKNNFLSKIGFKILGIPHIGIRLRARKIMQNLPNKIDILLDAGCGIGVYSFALNKKARNIQAVDIDKEKINYAKKINLYQKINFKLDDLCKLGYKKEYFDCIICSDVLEHIKNDKKAFSELIRVLRKEGILLITVPYNSKANKLNYKRYHHERAGYTEEYIRKLCQKNKAILIKSEGYSSPLTEKIFNFAYAFINKKILLGILFYPLYFLSIISDNFYSGKEYGGILFKIKKINN